MTPPPVVHHPHYVAALPPGHRFPMDKFGRLMARLRAEGLAGEGNVFTPSPAPREWLALAHDRAYVDSILDLTAGEETMRRIGLPLTASLARRARLAVGGTILAAELALARGVACNSAGGSHHAGFAHGAGFCVFNDVAVAARVAQARGLVRRILVVDLDVHQGDGTAEIFEGDESVFTFSMHAERNYPARKRRSDRDVGLPDGLGDHDYLSVLHDHLADLLPRLRPELVFYNAGVDPHAEDQLGRLALSDGGLRHRDLAVLAACRAAGAAVAAVIGGGYGPDMDALALRHASLFRAAARLASERPAAVQQA
jgi:acetoin utilization deacetylase AcuC-like enzyme